ncbi:MAG: hypothetical protein P8K77_05415 [Polaribacter sp.]|nr:hypothetical protein [Polaribacter sp.]
MRLLKKIKAGALQIVLVVAVVIIIILFAFISLLYVQQKLHLKNNHFKEAVYTTQQVFDYVAQVEMPQNTKDSLLFFSTKNKTVTTTKKQWGLFDVLTVKTRIKNEVFQKTGLMGASNTTRKALYLQENNKPLIVVGDTKITGNVSLPKLGVNSGNIAGVSYNGSRFVYGNRTQSDAQIPNILNRTAVTEFIANYANDTVDFLAIEEGFVKRLLFTQKTGVHRRNGSVELRNMVLEGHLIIESDTLIRVHASSQLKDVILIAPVIEILEGVQGNFQAFATQQITVKENCQLAYPTTLVLFDGKEGLKNKQISILKSSTIKGIISYISDTKEVNYKPQVFLDTHAVVFGEVYCQGNLELKGTVNGSVYTNSFIANQSGGIYINHIYNGTINAEQLPKQFSGLFLNGSSKNVAKWLD